MHRHVPVNPVRPSAKMLSDVRKTYVIIYIVPNISGAQCLKGRLYCKCLQFFGDSNKCTSTVFSVTCPDIDDGFFKKCQYAYSVGPLLKKRKKHDFYTHYL